MDIIQSEFNSSLPNARVMIKNVSIIQALEYKDKIAAINGVSSVTWLDDIYGADSLKRVPFNYQDTSITDNYYKDNTALYSITIASGAEKDTVAAIRDLIGDDNSVAGNAVNTAAMQEMSINEVLKALAILLPLVIIILILYTTSWIEPLLFLLSIGTAIIINMGTNIFLGKISFITFAVSPILQLAVSLDYAIFLLHAFNEFRVQYEPKTAMKLAMKKALSAVAASAATTVIGFFALIFMRFEVGGDLGINLVKGVILSFISVMVFLPVLTLLTYKLIDKTKHRPLLPSLSNIAKKIIKVSIVFFILASIVAIPCFLAQRNINFTYGTGDITQVTKAGQDASKINDEFGKENMLVLLVPKTDTGKEVVLCDKLSQLNHITAVASYVKSVGAQIPSEYVPNNVSEQFYSENYSRIILYTNLEEEGTTTFETVKSVLDSAGKYYDTYYLAGQAATLYDMKNVVSIDTKVVNIIAIIGIFIVLLLTFRSLTLPLILIFTIETAIWINLSFAYFANQSSFNFIGYLVVSTVQLGSTVDYAILITDRYLGCRRQMPKNEAIKKALGENFIAIVISAAILSLAGFTLAFTSTNSIIAQLGLLLGRGTLLSLFMVAFVLPSMLVIFDKAVQKTSLRNGFYDIPKDHGARHNKEPQHKGGNLK
ncbi:MAG: MMPL family transporter [Eubacteriaceae bacterium]|nr:MMPL family transporter [Eubacteriaceae bacterium]